MRKEPISIIMNSTYDNCLLTDNNKKRIREHEIRMKEARLYRQEMDEYAQTVRKDFIYVIKRFRRTASTA